MAAPITNTPARVSDLNLAIQVYTYFFTKLDPEEGSSRRSKRMKQETVIDHIAEGIKLARGRTDRTVASMFFGRLRDPKHPLAKNNVSLICMDYGEPGSPLVVCQYDPADLVVPSSTETPANPREAASAPDAAERPCLSWSAGRIKHLVNKLCVPSDKGPHHLPNAEEAIRNKWDSTGGRYDIPATVRKLLANGYFAEGTVTYRGVEKRALVLAMSEEKIVADLRARGELSEEINPRIVPRSEDSPDKPSSLPLTPLTEQGRDPAEVTVDEPKLVEEVLRKVRRQEELPTRPPEQSTSEERGAFLLPNEETLLHVLRRLVEAHGVGCIANSTDLFGTATPSEEQAVALGRFCAASFLETVSIGWRVIYDVRRLVYSPIEARRVILSSKNRVLQIGHLRRIWKELAKNGVANKQAVWEACGQTMGVKPASVEAYFFGNRLSGEATFSTGLVIQSPNSRSLGYLVHDSLAGSEAVPGEHAKRSFVLRSTEAEDRRYLQAIAAKYAALALKEFVPSPVVEEAPPPDAPKSPPRPFPPSVLVAIEREMGLSRDEDRNEPPNQDARPTVRVPPPPILASAPSAERIEATQGALESTLAILTSRADELRQNGTTKLERAEALRREADTLSKEGQNDLRLADALSGDASTVKARIAALGSLALSLVEIEERRIALANEERALNEQLVIALGTNTPPSH